MLQSVPLLARPTPGLLACLCKLNLEWLMLEAELEFHLPMPVWQAHLRRTQ